MFCGIGFLLYDTFVHLINMMGNFEMARVVIITFFVIRRLEVRKCPVWPIVEPL
jgi:hypothetical protein